MEEITAVIHTYNEEKNVEDCIKSAKMLANDIVVVDMESEDRTVELAHKAGARIFVFPHSSYVEPAREFGIQKANSEWVFILDADERITKELTNEVKSVINRKPTTYYKVARKNIFGGIKWLKHGGWWPDHQVRLINKKYFKSWPKEIHSTPHIAGSVGLLEKPLTHFFHGDIQSMAEKTIIFEDIESKLLFKAGKNVQTRTFFRKFLGELYRRYLAYLGFLDGEIGIIESLYQAFSKTITYLYLYEKKFKSSSLRSLS